MTEEGDMTDHFSTSKQRLTAEEEEGKTRKRRHSQDKESSDTSSHLRRHKRRKNRKEERRSHRRHRHTREDEKEGSSKSRTATSSLERKSKPQRSYSRESDSIKYSRTLNGYKYSCDRRSPRENHKAQRHSPVRRYRSRSRSPVSRYQEDSLKRYEPRWSDEEVDVRGRYRIRSRSPVRRYKWDSKRYESRFSYEEDVYDPVPRHSHGYAALKKEIKDLLRIEHHHLAYEGKEDSNGDVQGVEWCYKYLDPNIRGHITGGRAILHHRCRQCNRICLYLLGKCGTGKRMCLACAARERGWREEEVPSWYFHRAGACTHCKPRQNYFNRY